MIAEFKVENFLSFKNEQVLSFEATADKYLQEYHCIEINPEKKLLRLAMIYGANASGKSNLLLALDFFREIAIKIKNRGDKTGFIPFKFDENSMKQPGFFEISIYVNGIKYIYSIMLDEKSILDEKLVYYPGTQPAMIFHRVFNSINEDYEIKTGSTFKVSPIELAVLKSNTLNNMTLVAGLAKTNIKFKQLQEIYDWFSKGILKIIRPMNDLYRQTLTDIINNSADYKKFILENLEKADFNITDIQIESNDERILNMDTLDYSVVSDIDNTASYGHKNVYFIHKSNDIQNRLPIKMQSAGTLQYFGLLGKLKDVITNSSLLNIDELENSLHPDLVNHFINSFLYYSSKENAGAQFIFTTHNVGLLAEDFVRKDIVWFTEKKEDGSTQLFSLDEFDIRKNLSFLKAYKAGKFGAVPNLGII